MDLSRWTLRQAGEPPPVIGEAVLRNYPLRLWLKEREHTAAVLRELELIVGDDTGAPCPAAVQQLFDAANMFRTLFGTLLSGMFRARQAAIDAGLDRMDSVVPYVRRAPDYLDHYRTAAAAVDACSARGELLTPPRSKELIALHEWMVDEVTAQYYGAPPTPWAGPF
jgi:hypothetical protein